MNKPITSNRFVTDLWGTLQMFIDEAVLAEREACAKVCEAQEDNGGEWDIQQQCANAIRARGQA